MRKNIIISDTTLMIFRSFSHARMNITSSEKGCRQYLYDRVNFFAHYTSFQIMRTFKRKIKNQSLTSLYHKNKCFQNYFQKYVIQWLLDLNNIIRKRMAADTCFQNNCPLKYGQLLGNITRHPFVLFLNILEIYECTIYFIDAIYQITLKKIKSNNILMQHIRIMLQYAPL